MMRHHGQCMSIDDDVVKRLSHEGLKKLLRSVATIIATYEVVDTDHITLIWTGMLLSGNRALVDIEVTRDSENDIAFTLREAYELKDPFTNDHS